jgi:endo-1,4-beta-xylanase
MLLFLLFSLVSAKYLGNIAGNPVPDSFATYWNQMIAENGCKWGTVQNQKGSFNWGECDAVYNYSRQHGYPFAYHVFVWGSQEPGFINSATESDLIAFMQAAASRYTSIDTVQVVNEALHAPSSMRNALGGSGSSGWDWIIRAFELARQYVPAGKYIINDYGIISDPNEARQYVEIINLLKNRNLVDGIGIQCHQFNVNNVDASTARSVLDTLAATGLPIYVTEFDANGNSETEQANIYKRVFPVLWEHSAVQGVTLWGYLWGKTWKDGTGLLDGSHEREALTWLKGYAR